jgi:signal transduction histidine kinase
VAEERERRRLAGELHAGTLDALDEVADTWGTDRGRARARAGREAIRLRRALRRDGLTDGPEMAWWLEQVVGDVADQGLRVELIVHELERDPTAPQLKGVIDAVRAALENVLVHAGVSSVVVRAANSGDGVEVSIRDRGRGCTRTDSPTSVDDPVRAVGGETQWWSEPGRGARLKLRVPR